LTLLPVRRTPITREVKARRSRLSGLACGLALLVAGLVSPSLLRAQFQQPTDEELKMTADPKAPGAAAVYLNVEEITDDPMHYHSFYARIKVLTEKGKELASVELPYTRGNVKITDIKARTIHPDGTIIPLEGKLEDLLEFKSSGHQISERVFNLPSVEVGSILEYSYAVRYDDNHFSSPTWEIQRPYFVHKAHYAFTPFKAFMPGIENATSSILVDEHGNSINTLIWWPVLPPGVEVKADARGHYIVDVRDVPPIPDEEWMPPIQSVLYKVVFYYKNAFSGSDFWISEAKRWSKEVDHFAEGSKPIHEAVAGLVAPGDSDLDKAQKLYKAVQALDNTDFSRTRSQAELKQLGLHAAKRAEDTWAQKSGSGEDIALLYLAMLRAAGLTAYAMKVVDRTQRIFDPNYMHFGQLDDTIVILSIDGKDTVLDPGEKMCPFRTVHWKHSGAGGIRQSPDGRAMATSPLQPYMANTLLRIGDVTIDEHGTATGNFRFVMSGQEAIGWRQTALENDQDEAKKRFDEWLRAMAPDGVQAHLDHFLGLDDPDVNLIAVVKVEGTLGTATAKRLLLPGFFFETRGNRPFVGQDKRLEPVDMHFGNQVSDQVDYHLAPGLTVEGAPQDARIPWANHAALAIKTVPGTDEITIAHQLSRAFTFVKADEYKDLHDFYQKVATADQQQLVLTRAVVAKGN
jgi:hypothetical protein